MRNINYNRNLEENSVKLSLILTILGYIVSFSSIDETNIGVLLNIGMISTWLSICLFTISLGIVVIYKESKYSRVIKILDCIGLGIFYFLIYLN